MNDDSISRKQAIEAVQNRPFTLSKEKVLLINDLEKLPPTQPEIIRCKDCDWWAKQEESLQGKCTLLQIYPTGGWFCGNARRKGGQNEI